MILEDGTVLTQDFILAYGTVDQEGRAIGRVRIDTDTELVEATIEALVRHLYQCCDDPEWHREVAGALMNSALRLASSQGTAE